MNNLPEWLKPGELVEFAFSVGETVDVANGQEHVMVLVKSPKGIWRNHPAEWLEYKPDAIKPTTPDRAARDLDLYRGYIVKMLEEIDALRAEWLEPAATSAVATTSAN